MKNNYKILIEYIKNQYNHKIMHKINFNKIINNNNNNFINMHNKNNNNNFKILVINKENNLNFMNK